MSPPRVNISNCSNIVELITGKGERERERERGFLIWRIREADEKREKKKNEK